MSAAWHYENQYCKQRKARWLGDGCEGEVYVAGAGAEEAGLAGEGLDNHLVVEDGGVSGGDQPA